MAQTLVERGPAVAPLLAEHGGPRPYWNPHLVGFMLGLVLLSTYAVTGRGLGATAAFSSVAAWFTGLTSPMNAAANPVHAKYWNEGAPLESWTLFLLVGAFVGALLSGWQGKRVRFTVERGPGLTDRQRLATAFGGGLLAAFGAKLARGCTSGQALTGGAMLSAGSLVFMLAVFAAAFGLAYFVRKEWL